MSTLRFQPEAERYYAEGHWRPGDLWEDFAARAQRSPARSRWCSTTARVTYDELRRAAVGAVRPAGRAAVQPGDVVMLLGRHSIEAAVALLGCLHRGVVLAPLPPMFNVTQLVALARQTGARAIVGVRRRAGDREVRTRRAPEVER